jgi:hypothetical protein
LQIIPEVSNTYGQPVTAVPLSIVMLFVALKDLAEDLQRRAADKKENSRKVWKADAAKAEFVEE